MPNESSKPFTEPKPRDPNDPALVEWVLGSGARSEMDELVGEVNELPVEELKAPDELTVSEAEEAEVERAGEGRWQGKYTEVELKFKTRNQLEMILRSLGVSVDWRQDKKADLIRKILATQ